MAEKACKEAVVTGVVPGSIADEVGIGAGDILVSINSAPMEDIIDYRYLISDEEIVLLVRKPNGEEWEVEVEKEIDEDLGIEFASATFDAMRHCANRCMFCFIDQNPPHLRPTLYEYDDDYRLSFLYGQFVTLTNLRKRDWERIVRLHLSPLYVSVHTTDPALRAKMLGSRRAADIRQHLDFLRDHGITIHVQIVLCPGLNDGEQLTRTINDLATYYPAVQSVAVVPVGITRHRENLPPIRPLNKEDAVSLISQVDAMHQQFLATLGTRFVWVGDEVYIANNLPLPADDYYETMPQVENGVGITRLFLHDFAAALTATKQMPRSQKLSTIVTGVLGAAVLRPLTNRLESLGVRLQLIPVRNHFFGETITASGLVTGGDILKQLGGQNLGDEVLLPQVMLRRYGPSVFLDNTTLEQLQQEVKVPVVVLEGARDLVDHLVQ